MEQMTLEEIIMKMRDAGVKEYKEKYGMDLYVSEIEIDEENFKLINEHKMIDGVKVKADESLENKCRVITGQGIIFSIPIGRVEK